MVGLVNLSVDSQGRDEGVIKFDAHWTRSAPFSENELSGLIMSRNDLYQSGLIGEYEDGTGFGNISQRIGDTDCFYISGSATGGIPSIGTGHFSRVDDVDIHKNRLWCTGPVVASSESMTHAVIYRESPDTNAVVHVHNRELWNQLMGHVPTTPIEISYGTPDMAEAVVKLFNVEDLIQKKIFVMAGHEDGVFAFGQSLDEAMDILMSRFRQLH